MKRQIKFFTKKNLLETLFFLKKVFWAFFQIPNTFFKKKNQKTNILAKSGLNLKKIFILLVTNKKQIQKLIHKIIILTKKHSKKKKLLQNRIQLISALMINGNAWTVNVLILISCAMVIQIVLIHLMRQLPVTITKVRSMSFMLFVLFWYHFLHLLFCVLLYFCCFFFYF